MWTPGSASLRAPNSIFRGLDAVFVRNTDRHPGSSRNTIRREPATTLQSLSDPPPASRSTSTQVHEDSEPLHSFRHAELKIPVSWNKHHRTRHPRDTYLGPGSGERSAGSGLGVRRSAASMSAMAVESVRPWSPDVELFVMRRAPLSARARTDPQLGVYG